MAAVATFKKKGLYSVDVYSCNAPGAGSGGTVLSKTADEEVVGVIVDKKVLCFSFCF